jgi:hypothetical protein
MYGFPQKHLYCSGGKGLERNGNLPGQSGLLFPLGASNPDFCTPISCRAGERQSMGQKKPVDIHDKEYAWKWIIAQSNVPIRLSGVRHPHRVRVGGQMD